jgi:hypothetical protein
MTFRKRRGTSAPGLGFDADAPEPTRLLPRRFTETNLGRIRQLVGEVGTGLDFGTGHFLDDTVDAWFRGWAAGTERDYQDRQEETQRRIDGARAVLERLKSARETDQTETEHAAAALEQARARVRGADSSRRRATGYGGAS